MESLRDHGGVSVHPTTGARSPKESSEGAVLTREELSARLHELEQDVCNLQQVVCHLLLKNETLRQNMRRIGQEPPSPEVGVNR